MHGLPSIGRAQGRVQLQAIPPFPQPCPIAHLVPVPRTDSSCPTSCLSSLHSLYPWCNLLAILQGKPFLLSPVAHRLCNSLVAVARMPLGLMMMQPWLCQSLLASFLQVSLCFRGQAWLDQQSTQCYGSTVTRWSSIRCFGGSYSRWWMVGGFTVTEVPK